MKHDNTKTTTAASAILSAVLLSEKPLLRVSGVLCAVLACCLCLAGCVKTPGPDESTPGASVKETSSAADTAPEDPEASLPPESASADRTETASPLLTDGVYISGIFAYSGAYVEDGTNAPCENVCAVVLRNDSGVHYQYLTFELETAGGSYAFSASTLFSGAEMTVLCEGAAAFTDDTLVSLRVTALAPFTETPSVHTDTLEITYTDGFINVKNKTDAPLTDVYVYYKNTDENGYLGGITYRAYLGTLNAGELKQARASNMRRETGRVVFATYGE